MSYMSKHGAKRSRPALLIPRTLSVIAARMNYLSEPNEHAAGALGLQDKIGTISVGKQADLTLWDIGHPRELCYFAGLHKPSQVWFKGQLLGQV